MNIGSYLSQYLDSTGDGTGTTNMAAVADEYMITPGASQHYEITRMLVQLQDNAAFAVGDYGAASALTTGCKVELRDVDGTVLNTPSGQLTIKTNEDWARLCFDTVYQDYGGGGSNKVLNVRWSFDKAGQPILLKSGQSLVLMVQDSLATLVGHYALIQGRIIT